jgi:hypothetical protein
VWARVHPGETPASFCVMGLINYLLSTKPEMVRVRVRVRVVVVWARVHPGETPASFCVMGLINYPSTETSQGGSLTPHLSSEIAT